MRDVLSPKSAHLIELALRLLDVSVTTMFATSKRKFARSLNRVAVGKAPNIFAPHFRSTLLTTHTRSLAAACHREKRGDR